MNKCFFIVFSVSLLLLSCQQQQVKQSPTSWQWRGENRDGVYYETGLLKVWPAEGPELLWYFEKLGDGHTTVAIANGKVYATGMQGDRLMLYVFDMSGKLLAEKDAGKEWDENWNGTRSTICINDGMLYIFSAHGVLYCIDEATLNEVWKKDILNELDGKNLQFGMVENPLIVEDKIFMHPGGEVNNFVALNKKTGALIWSSPGEGTVSAYCSPQYIPDQSVPIVVTSSFEHIMGFNADTGEMLWSYPQTSQFRVHPNIPIYSNGMIYSSVGGGGGSTMLRLTNGGRAVELVWKNELDIQLGGAVKVGDYVYGAGQTDRSWFCVDWKTGETKYKVREVAPCNVIYADGMLYCYSETGKVYLVKPNPDKLEVVSSFEVTLGTEQHWAHPVIYDGTLYIRHGNALMAYKIK